MAYLSQIADSKSVKKMHGRITADKKLRYASPKLLFTSLRATSSIRKPSYEILKGSRYK